jgi:hypothetical protein
VTNEFQNWMQWLSLVIDEDDDAKYVDIEYERGLFTASIESIFELASDSLSAGEGPGTGQGSATKPRRFNTPGAVGTEVLNVSFYVKRVRNIVLHFILYCHLKRIYIIPYTCRPCIGNRRGPRNFVACSDAALGSFRWIQDEDFAGLELACGSFRWPP